MGGLLDLTSERMWHSSREIVQAWVQGREWVRLPLVKVSGGQVTRFNRAGVDYTQIVFRQNGSLNFSSSVADVTWALGAGGASSANAWNRAGGGAGDCEIRRDQTIESGNLNVFIGAGGIMGAITGSPSRLSGLVTLEVLPGGMGAGGSAAAGTGANGGGASSIQPAGIGTKHTGGAADSTRSGGGAGAGGDGGNGGVIAGKGGDGGPGVLLDFMEPPTGVCGGGGGTSDRSTAGTQGNATHNGTPGLNTGTSQDADWGGGAGGVRVFGAGNTAGKGGDGFFVLVYPTANAITEMAT